MDKVVAIERYSRTCRSGKRVEEKDVDVQASPVTFLAEASSGIDREIGLLTTTAMILPCVCTLIPTKPSGRS